MNTKLKYRTFIGMSLLLFLIGVCPKNVIGGPTTITDFDASDGLASQVMITWTNPGDINLTEVVVRRKIGLDPIDHTDGDLIYQDTIPSPGESILFADTTVAELQTYHYAVFSMDSLNSWNDTVDAVDPDRNADIGYATGDQAGHQPL